MKIAVFLLLSFVNLSTQGVSIFVKYLQLVATSREAEGSNDGREKGAFILRV